MKVRTTPRQLRASLMASGAALGMAMGLPAWAQDAPVATTQQISTLDEIVVTATRVEQSLSRVPMSVQAFSPQALENQSIREFGNLAEATPGVRFTQGGRGNNTITIRGIQSGSGASTTGLYIDDMPIQVRGMGFAAGAFTPTIFDLERVEVLRGPQGTLFGDSSMGGAVRFITPQPDLYGSSGYGRAEVSQTRGGGVSYEAGYAMGGPIVEGVLGFRASAYFRHSAGWIDRMAGVVTALSPTGTAGPLGSLDFQETGLIATDTNSSDTVSLRAALTWQPHESLAITPSLHYERRTLDDRGLDFWPMLSDPGSSRFIRPIWRPVVDANHTPLPDDAPLFDTTEDRFFIPSVQVEWETPFFDLVSTTAYFDRTNDSRSDQTITYVRLFSRSSVPQPGDFNYLIDLNAQEIFTQEIRLQSNNPDARLTWVAGLFYSTNWQISEQTTRPNFVMANVSPPAVDDGPPFGPGYSAYMNHYGVEPEDSVTFSHRLVATTDQIALFGQADYDLTDRLTLTVGLRVAEVDLGFDASYGGPNNNQNQPRGLACVPGTGVGDVPCDPVAIGQYRPGEGPFALRYEETSNSGQERPVTPKVGLSFQQSDDTMFYATVAQGYRAGGAQARVPGTCRDELISLGYTDGLSPETYDSDTVLSYETGVKSRLFGGLASIDLALFHIKWEDIQTVTALSSCGTNFIRNGLSATSQGFDLSLTLRPAAGLTLGLVAGYQDATRDEDEVYNNRVLASAGSSIAGPSLQLGVNGEYNFALPGGTEAYARLDYIYISEGPEPDTRSVNYDPMIPRSPESHLLNGRVGVYINDVNLYLFGRNLLNADEVNLSRSRNTPIYSGTAPQPRTVGLGASYRF